MTDDLLQVSTEKVGDSATVLTVRGELDRDSMHILGAAADAALDAGATRLVLALGGLSFCDSSGLRLFVEMHKRAADRGAALHLAELRPTVATIIQVVNLDRMLALHSTVQDAIG
ncbi:STAS domain-containing protein [Actinoplanes sp. NPDC051411]|uniref:STAS domain-containing protein n=1 Tax=Actinoplanes sp. NPDC051411 TaxID=3155522 RepID=UPI00342E831B